ncbi:MAG: molecular chaperone DnaJ [Acidimicrobiales bacterium]|nr:molecular chaperone DnaJ [Acidimicrobiales bacterium]
MTPQPEWFEKDYYKVLGVSETATAKEITRAYRKLARELHPDANPGDASAEDRFKDVSAAYEVLGDEAKRKEYDEVRKLGPLGGVGFGGQGGPFGGGSGGFSFDASDLGDLGDLFGGLFGRGGRRGAPRSGPRGTGPHRGADLEAELRMEFRDAVRGITTTLHLTSEASCSNCNGTGSRPGSAPTICQTCHGRGVLDENQGLFSFSAPCQACAGRGMHVTDPCPTCDGTGTEHRPRAVKVRIPAGVDDGQKIKLKGRGAPGRNGGPAGDLYVKVAIEPDPLFTRDGRNLRLTVPVTFPEAALGTDQLTVPTLDGEAVTLRLPAGTGSGKVLRVKGRGIKDRKGTGDLLVTVKVVVPSSLTPEQRDAIEAFAAASPESPRASLGIQS